MQDFVDDTIRRVNELALAMAQMQSDMIGLLMRINLYRIDNYGPIELPLPGLSTAAQSEGAVIQGEDQVPQKQEGAALPPGQGAPPSASIESRSSQFVTAPGTGDGSEEEPEPVSGPDEAALVENHYPVPEAPPPADEWVIQNGNVLDENSARAVAWADEVFPEPKTKLTSIPVAAISDRVLPPLTAKQSVLYCELSAKMIGKALQIIRRSQKANINGAEVAAHLSFQRGTLYNYERGGSKPGPERLAQIVTFYGLTLEDFFDRAVAMLPKEDEAHRAMAAHEGPLFTFNEAQRLITTGVGSTTIPTAAWEMVLAMRSGRTARTNDLVTAGSFRSVAGAKVTLSRVRPLLREIGLRLTQPGGDSYRIELP